MRLPLSWIKDYLNLDGVSIEDLASRLTLAGAEVESIEEVGGDINGVVIGKILSMEKHPNADNLKVCKVDVGGLVKTVISGASNIFENAFIPVALVGTILPNDMPIKKRKIRGLQSEGMLCSKMELNLEEHSDGVWILPDNLETGGSIVSVLGARDYIIEVDVTANRGDLLSVLGLAREIGAIYDKRVSLPYPDTFESASGNIDVVVENEKGCPKYTARIIRNVKVGPSPQWLVRRLEMASLRSVNNIVDVTNYVLLEYGQPLHAFDLNKLKGQKIIVRNAKKGESIRVIDGTEHKLDEDILVIADAESPVACAGIMGGADSEIGDSTTDILLESAYFNPVQIRLGSKKLSLKSDASYRYERGINPDTVITALNRAASLIVEVSEGAVVASKVKDVSADDFEKKVIMFHVARASEIIGDEIERTEISKIFMRLNFGVVALGKDAFKVEVPLYRHDIETEIDLIEEVARIHGYNNIPAKSPKIVSNTVKSNYQDIFNLKKQLASYGLYETVNFSMADASLHEKLGFDPSAFIKIPKAISAELNILRPNLLVDMMKTLKRNRHRNRSHGAYFEVGSIFRLEDEKFVEKRMAAGVLYSERAEKTWNNEEGVYDFYDASGIVSHLLTNFYQFDDVKIVPSEKHIFLPGVSAEVFKGSKSLGFVGEINPSITKEFDLNGRAFVFCLSVDALLEESLKEKFYEPIFRFPPVYRDLALVCSKDISFGKVLSYCKSYHDTISDVSVVDVYEGKQVESGKRSIALSLVYNSHDKTLTDTDVESVEKSLLADLEKEFSITLRT